ncbi:MAG: hypothetical protein QF412_06620 [Planctomycetota bacterium]|jgi:hypothetical protein|nr:hypothetical protein [Planctomycetota bacterium]
MTDAPRAHAFLHGTPRQLAKSAVTLVTTEVSATLQNGRNRYRSPHQLSLSAGAKTFSPGDRKDHDPWHINL